MLSGNPIYHSSSASPSATMYTYRRYKELRVFSPFRPCTMWPNPIASEPPKRRYIVTCLFFLVPANLFVFPIFSVRRKTVNLWSILKWQMRFMWSFKIHPICQGSVGITPSVWVCARFFDGCLDWWWASTSQAGASQGGSELRLWMEPL